MAKATKDRRDEIVKVVLTDGEVKVKELSELFHVSTETIRKDLAYLDACGMVAKTHGGAKVVTDYYQLPVDVKLQENVVAKRWIARKALDFIEDGDVIFMDSGSTTIQLAKLLKIRNNLTIVTNSLVVSNLAMEAGHNVICTGGTVQKRGKCLVGYYAINVIDSIHFDVMITGSDGFKGMGGPTTFSLEEVEIRKHAIRNSDRKILIVDASKFTRTSTYQFAKFEDYDVLITNESSDLDKDVVRKMRRVCIVKGE